MGRKPNARGSRNTALTICALALANTVAVADTSETVATPNESAPVSEPSSDNTALAPVIVTARRRAEDAQKVPASFNAIGGELLDKTYTYNTDQLSQLVPALNYTSPNPRNTAYTIRGLGSSVVAVSQANDGLEPGVGFYVDQVYHARPATAAFDFTDIDQVEVLRGPQGTLFGKNTTAGAVHVTTRAPSFDAAAQEELSVGTDGFVQAEGWATGTLVDGLMAGRVSALITRRDGVLDNVTVGGTDNNVHNDALRGQLLIEPSDTFRLRLIADYSAFDSHCCTQVYVRVGTTLKPAARQYPVLAAGVDYMPASFDPFDRKTDIDAELGVDTNEGGLSAIADWDLGFGTLTSVTAWRWWNWDAANDRDYTSLSIQTLQHIPSRQDQYSQEFRVASNGDDPVTYVTGLYWFYQKIHGDPITVYGPLATYWLLGPEPAFPANLLDGYGTSGATNFRTHSDAIFAEATWHITQRLAWTAGLRYTDENKDGDYVANVAGGLATTDPKLIAAKLSILRPQAYDAHVTDGSPSGRTNLAYELSDAAMTYLSYARGQQSGGINMSGLPLNAANQPALATAVIKPEHNTTWELGLKTQWFERRLTLNVDAYHTAVEDFQANVVDTGPGALRGYLANIPKVTVKGGEFDATAYLAPHWSLRLSGAYADGRYTSYPSAPCPLELIGSTTTVCNLSGLPLPGLPRWSGSVGAEYAAPVAIGNSSGEGYARVDASARSKVTGDPSDSRYTVIRGYGIVNGSVGFRAARWEATLFARNLLNHNYFENLTIQAGNSGLIIGTPSDPRVVGITLRLFQ